MKNPRISVVTPTYNRARTLPALRDSLVRQEFKDFEWVVVDDGSVDDTAILLKTWLAEGNLDIRVLTRPNGGKHRALNDGIKAARGDWVFIVDSDDYLPDDALARLGFFSAEAEKEPRACGIMGLKAYSDGRLVGEELPKNVRCANALELTYRYGIRGDKAEAYKSSVLKRFPFPEFEGEKFLTEAVVWYRMARSGWSLLLCPEVLYKSTYHPDGLSARSLALRVDNLRGTLLFYKEEIEGGLRLPGALREAANYVRFCLYARGRLDAADIGSASLTPRARKLARLASPFGYLAWLRDKAALEKSSSEPYY